MANPTKYTPELANRICELLSTTDRGLVEVLEMIRAEFGDAPSTVTVQTWRKTYPEFRDAYKEAREMQGELIHDDAHRYAREPLLGIIEKTVIKPNGREIHTTSSDNVERSKLLVQTCLRRAGVLNPRYGEKVQAELSGELAIKRVVSDL